MFPVALLSKIRVVAEIFPLNGAKFLMGSFLKVHATSDENRAWSAFAQLYMWKFEEVAQLFANKIFLLFVQQSKNTSNSQNYIRQTGNAIVTARVSSGWRVYHI